MLLSHNNSPLSCTEVLHSKLEKIPSTTILVFTGTKFEFSDVVCPKIKVVFSTQQNMKVNFGGV